MDISKRKLRREQYKEAAKEEIKEEKKPEIAVKVYKDKKGFFYNLYVYNYKKLMIIPFLILVLALVQIGIQTATTGDFINKGVSLKGGITVTIPTTTAIDISALENELRNELTEHDINVKKLSEAGRQKGILVEADVEAENERELLVETLETKTGMQSKDFAIETMGSSLGRSFFKETMVALLFAFLFMGIVVFIYFRTFVPSIAVILAAFSDMVITLAIINVLGIKLSTAGIAAFLMLIGYSVDTDILLTTRIIKRKEGTHISRIFGALKTGLTMNITTMAAITVALFFSQSEVLTQIMTILLIGLFVDMINTWIQNMGILRWYLEKKKNE